LKRSTNNVTIETILKVFNALKANARISVQLFKTESELV
jgi:hypothetical protein